MKLRLFSLSILGAALFLTACAKDQNNAYSNFGYSRHLYERQTERGTGQWSTALVKLTCEGSHCRPQVGMLIEVESQTAVEWTIGRCTATLIGSDLVVTAAHCLNRNLDKPTHFLMTDGQSRRVAGVEYWRFTPDVDGKKSDIAPDVAVLRLQASIDDVAPLALASGNHPRYGSLKALVVNANSSTEYRIDEVTCPIRRTAEFPFEIDENPELILSVGCNVIPGNSGAPLFAPGRDEIEAVVQANVPTDKRGLGWFGNLRCHPVMGREAATCVPLNKTTQTDRFTDQLVKAADAIPGFSKAERRTWQTRDDLFQYNLDTLVDGLPVLEVISQPKCLRNGVDQLTDVRFVDQLVRFDNSTGAFKAELLKSRTVVGRVVSNYKKLYYQIEVDWPAPYAAFTDPAGHPSVRLGRSFKIEIPRCAG